MNNIKYRVKVETTNGGKKRYTPQVGIPKLSVGRFDHLWIYWENIITDDYGIDGFSKPSKTLTYYYESEDLAMRIIERYKKYLIKQESKKIKSVTYININ